MEIQTALLKAQIKLLKPLTNTCPVGFARSAQDRMGELMSRPHRDDVKESEHDFGTFGGCWILPTNRKHRGAVLYLHGGAYVTGGLEYSKGFGTVLAANTGADVFCAAYRLAPENPYPAALNDALTSYDYMISCGYPEENIAFCGESAGGGLIFALALKLRELGRKQPGAIIAISPWTDLSISGESHERNADRDPSLTTARLDMQAKMYSQDVKNPYVSPLFADLHGLTRSMIFVGEDEILLDDSIKMFEKLTGSGCVSSLTVRKDMWHAYILFGVKEAEDDLRSLSALISEVTGVIPQT